MKMDDNLIYFDSQGVTESTRLLYTPGEFAKHNLVYLQEVGRLKSLQPHRCIRENLDSYLFLKVLEGSGTIIIKNTTYHLFEGDCVFLNCMEHYEHISNSENSWKLAWIHFNGVNVRAYYDLYEGYQLEKQVFRIGSIAEDTVELLLKLPKSSSLLSDMEAGERLLSFCNAIVRTVLCSEENTDNIININDVRTFINENYIESKLEEKIAEHFKTDFENVNTLFLKKFGIDVIGYITSRRFNAAKELLRFTTKPLEEVNKESGINDLLIIQQTFMENEGMSPEEYRMKWTQWIKS